MVLINHPQIRSKSLDLLRALAVLLVMGSHLQICPQSYGFLYPLILRLHWGGWTGVDLFFVLSGFLISGLLFKEHQRFGHISFKHFFIRRAFKIYPAYYIMLLITYVLFISKNPAVSLKALIPWAIFLQDYVPPAVKIMDSYWIHTWSLAVEEQFYLFLPILLISLSRASASKNKPFRLIPVIAFVLSVICLSLRVLSFVYNGNSFRFFLLRAPFHLRLDSLFFGVLVSYFYHYHPFRFREIVRRFKYLMLGMGIALFIPAFILTENIFLIPTAGYALLYLGSGLALSALVDHPLKTNPIVKAITALGYYSYSIYLWHLPVRVLCARLLWQPLLPHFNWGLYAIAYTLGSLVVGILMARLVETPMLKWRDRLYPTRSKSPVGQHVPSV